MNTKLIRIFILNLVAFQIISCSIKSDNKNDYKNIVTTYNAFPYEDVQYFSNEFNTFRNYRIYLPKTYDNKKLYPVVYYFHGWSGRYKWDAYDLEDDEAYPENGRKEPPFVMEWKKYTQNNDVIIVTWDGYVPIHKGIKTREGIRYGSSTPYDCLRAHKTNIERMGWDFSAYFRELVKNVDENYNTIADRDNRAITGLSMGGLAAIYVAGQNKDLVSSISSFDPADNVSLYGINEMQAVFPILEMYRSLNGLSVRLTATDGDWLKYNDYELRKIMRVANVNSFEYHEADYPDHWAADIDKQLDFHKHEFTKKHELPTNWEHVNAGFPKFTVWGYNIDIERSEPALTIIKGVTPRHIKILDRAYLPDGKIVVNENISVLTDRIYSPKSKFKLINYNLSDKEFVTNEIESDSEGKLLINLNGGGNVTGINGKSLGSSAIIKMVMKQNQEYFYFEKGKKYSLNFDLINVGENDAKDIKLRVFSEQPYIQFSKNTLHLNGLNSAAKIEMENQFEFMVTEYIDSISVGNIQFEITVDGVVTNTQRMMFFAIPKSPYINSTDVIVLDGRKVDGVPIFDQSKDKVIAETISGGTGNGNGKIDRGELVAIYLKLPKGMSDKDLNSYHKTYLLNQFDNKFLRVDTLAYFEKIAQAGATSITTILGVDKEIPDNYVSDLWFQVESLYNDKNDPTSRATIYARKYKYRRVKLKIE